MKNNNIALGGLFAGLHVLFLLIGKVILGSELALVLFLPLLSTIYTYKCDIRNVFMFMIATILVCCLFDLTNTFIYILPSLICGVVYGALRKKGCKEMELLIITSFLHSLTIAFSFFVLFLLFKEMNFISIFEKIFSLKGDKLIVATISTLLVFGFCEAFIVHLISDSELNKFSYKIIKNETTSKGFLIVAILSFILYVILSFFNMAYSILFILIFIIFFVPFIIEGILNYKYKILTNTLIIIFSFISIYLINYMEVLDFVLLPFFVLSPFTINNFKYKEVKNF